MARTTVVGACPHDCPDTCSILTTVEDGKAIAVRGNPDHPFTRGRLCVKVNNYEERVYSDKRVLYPLKRVGPEGLRAVPADLLGRGDRDHRHALEGDHRRTWRPGDPALQLPGHAGHHQRPECRRSRCSTSSAPPCPNAPSATPPRARPIMMTIGHTPGVDPESFVHSKYILLWACNTLSTNSHHWPFIEQARKAGAKLVVIDPVRTRTARLADWHIPIRPGHRRGAGAGDDPRHHQGEPGRSRLHRQAHRRLRRTGGTGVDLYA